MFFLIFFNKSETCGFSKENTDRLNIDDLDVEDEFRPEFPCPYCYEDFDVASLCSHLEDDHSCESKVTVRPFSHSICLFPHLVNKPK